MANLQLSKLIFRSILATGNRSCISCVHKSTASAELDIDETEDASNLAVVIQDENSEQRELEIELSRNKSRLLPQHRNVLMETKPYSESQSWIHNTLKYNRTMFGRYGLASGVDPRICFESSTEKTKRSEYEKVAYPHTLQQLMSINEKQRKEKSQKIRDREDSILKKLDKLEQWTAEVNNKVAKKEADAKAAKERKDRLVEEVRRQFGFKVDTRDERFKELLAQKEKEDKKKQKEAKRKLKDEKMLAKLQEKHTEEFGSVVPPPK